MAFKYQKFDRKLFAWLRGLRASGTTATTAEAIVALGASKNKTLKRHISRRFTQLEDKGVLKCTLRGTTRICEVVADIPVDLSKQHWRSGITKAVHSHLDAAGRVKSTTVLNAPSIRARTSEEFLAAGGTIEYLPTNWDAPRLGSKPLGDSFSLDD